MRHRQLWIQRQRALERVDRFIVVEGVDQRQALVECLLRVGVLGADGMVQFAQFGLVSRALRRRLCSGMMIVIGADHG